MLERLSGRQPAVVSRRGRRTPPVADVEHIEALVDARAGQEDAVVANDDVEPALVPELLVRDVTKSMEFWCGLCGFDVLYHRPEEGFAYLVRGSAHIMLEQTGVGRNWVTAPLQAPLGRGINFQISVPDLDPLLVSLRLAGWALFMNPEEKWYRVDEGEAGVRQFLVSDPDGYLLRFQASIGRR